MINSLESLRAVQDSKKDGFIKEKELMNYVLEYRTKLRTYTRFYYHLKSLDEDKRLDNAVKLVNTTTPQTELKALNLELEKLNTQYELIEIKQQLYLLLLKICKIARIDQVSDYVFEKEYRYGTYKLKGQRILQLTQKDFAKFESDFLKEYILENEFRKILCVEASIHSSELIKELEQKGIQIYTEMESLQYDELIEVPMNQFKERVSMEYWIADHYILNPKLLFYINDLEKLINIDSYSLEGK